MRSVTLTKPLSTTSNIWLLHSSSTTLESKREHIEDLDLVISECQVTLVCQCIRIRLDLGVYRIKGVMENKVNATTACYAIIKEELINDDVAPADSNKNRLDYFGMYQKIF